ncbi:MAG: type II secretion system F family protein [Planctomycetota bacterium]|jgi:type II secretory pathway component PulF
MVALFFILPVVLAVALGYAAFGEGRSWSLGHFTSYLAAVTRRNLPLGSSLSAYAQDLPGWRWGKRRVLLKVADAVDSGLPLADALDNHRTVFPAPYRALIRAAERGGNLARVLGSLADTVDFESTAARRVGGHALYPAAVAAAAVLATTFFAALIVPKFHQMVCELTPPGVERFPVAGLALWARGLAIVLLAAFLVIVFVHFFPLSIPFSISDKTGAPIVERYWSWLVWHMPLVRRYERRRAVAQYAVAAGRLMEAGVPTHEALDIAARASGNTHFGAMTLAAAGSVGEGGKLVEGLRAADARSEIPADFMWYVELGEVSGKLPETLVRAAAAASERSRRSLERLASLVLPVGILLVAGVVALLGYAVFGALVGLMEQLV